MNKIVFTKRIVVLLLALIPSMCVAQKNNHNEADSLSMLYNWNGKQITYKQYRDSLTKSYREFTDSIRLDSLNRRKRRNN